jgi:hypothetical protein
MLQNLCELTAAYVLAFQLVGLANIFTGKPIIGTSLVVITTFAVLAGWMVYKQPRLPSSPPGGIPFRWPIIALGVTYSLFLTNLLTSYPTGYDTIAYHLLLPVQWLQSGSMRLADTWWKDSLPSNGELFSLPVFAIIPQRLISLGNMIATAMLALSIYVVSKHICRSREGALMSSIVFLSAPIVIFQTFSFNVDVFGTAFIYAALACLFVFAETRVVRPGVLCALCAGVAIGTKHSFIPYAAPILAAEAIIIIGIIKENRIALLFVVIISSLAPSSLWIARNWQGTGNPFYPFAVHAGVVNLKGARGFPPFLVKASVTGPIGEAGRNNPVSEDRGFGPAFVTFAVASVLAAILEAFRTRRVELMALISIFAIMSVFWWTTLHVIRFGLPLYAMIAVFSGILFGMLTTSHRRIAKVLLTTGVAVSCLMTLIAPAHMVLDRVRSRDFTRAAFYGYPAIIDTLPVGTTILDRTLATRMGFVLAGRNLTNSVRHVDGPLDAATLSFDYAVRDGKTDPDDRILAHYGDLVYRGYPDFIAPGLKEEWRIYKMRK